MTAPLWLLGLVPVSYTKSVKEFSKIFQNAIGPIIIPECLLWPKRILYLQIIATAQIWAGSGLCHSRWYTGNPQRVKKCKSDTNWPRWFTQDSPLPRRHGPDQWCANLNPDSDLNLDSKHYRVDSDSDSDLDKLNPDSDSRKNWWIRIQIRIRIRTSGRWSINLHWLCWIRIRIRIQSCWIRIRIRIQENWDGFGFVWIRIRDRWIRIRIRIRSARIRTSLVWGDRAFEQFSQFSLWKINFFLWKIISGSPFPLFIFQSENETCSNALGFHIAECLRETYLKEGSSVEGGGTPRFTFSTALDVSDLEKSWVKSNLEFIS